MFRREDVIMRLFQRCFFIIRPAFRLKCEWFIIWRHWFGWFLTCTWIRWVIRRCFWQVIWGLGGQRIIQKIYIILCCMDTLFFLCVFHCGFNSLLIFRNLLLIIHISVHFSLFILFLWFLLLFSNSLLFYTISFLTLNIFLSFLIPPHCIIMTQYFFQYLLSLLYHAKTSRSLWIIIFVKVASKSQFTIGIFQIILCCRLIQTKNMII